MCSSDLLCRGVGVGHVAGDAVRRVEAGRLHDESAPDGVVGVRVERCAVGPQGVQDEAVFVQRQLLWEKSEVALRVEGDGALVII